MTSTTFAHLRDGGKMLLGALSVLRAAWLVVAVAVLGPLFTGCALNLGGETATPQTEVAPKSALLDRTKPVKIAMLLPLAGLDQNAGMAKALKQAGEMALFERNNPAVQLIVKDDKGTAAGARVATEDAIREGAQIIIGPLYARAVEGAAPVARAANVPMLAFSNDIRTAGNGVFLMSFLVEPEVERIIAFAAAQGRKRFAALIPNSDYGRAVEPVFRRAVAQAGGTIEILNFYPPSANGLLAPAKDVFAAMKTAEQAGAPVDALFLPGGSDVLPHLGPLIAYSGIDIKQVKLLGTGAWDYPSIGRDDAFVGGWYPSPDPAGWRGFSERFARTFGSSPPRVASLAFDAVSAAIDMAESQDRFTPGNITRATGFASIDGTVRFLPTGLPERGLAVLEVQKFGASIADPMPAGAVRTDQATATSSRVN